MASAWRTMSSIGYVNSFCAVDLDDGRLLRAFLPAGGDTVAAGLGRLGEPRGEDQRVRLVPLEASREVRW